MKNILIETYGCTANQNDSEIIGGILEKDFNVIFGKANKKLDLDLVILNTCIVKGPTLKRMERRINDLLKEYKKIIVCGCMASSYTNLILKIKENIEKKFGNRNIAIISPDKIYEIKNIVKKILENDRDYILINDKKFKEKLFLPKKRINRVIGITQIASGCVSNCSFCITKIAKGYLKSYDIEKIVKNIKKDIREGCKEILLTATDIGCYGLDKGKYMLVDLLKKIINIDGRFLIRVGMMNPEHLKNFIDPLLDVYENKKIFKFLHVPLQSGSDKVLEEMKRNYSVKDFLEIVKAYRKKFPNATLATDIIVGFYNENENDFKETIKIIKKTKPEIVNISRFWPMPKTLAYKKSKEKIDEIIKIGKERSKKLSEITKKISYEKNKRLIGKELICLVDKKGYGKSFLARDINYKLIAINEKLDIGKFYKVKITGAKSNFLIGKI
ncbi:MAG: tRNA (N(6)-L-threonylcarbamoyladenosine(37)-C(2))-methylthiotransferase [Candidatus Pacearchaeota archaeon]